MHYISYNKEILTAQAEIIRLFSNIVIVSRKTEKKTLVPCVFGQSSRILKSIFNPSGAPQIYPIISIERGGINIDQNRNMEINHDIAIMGSPKLYDPNTKPPTPISITFSVKVFSKYPEELDMIVSNFIPFFNKDVFVKTPHPKIDGKYLAHQIIWDGQIETEWKSQLGNSDQDIQVASLSFKYKTELFGGTDKLNNDPIGQIITINMSLSPSDGSIYPKFDPTNPDGNIISGMYAVPYAKTFEEYADTIITDYMGGNCDVDNYFIYNAYNAMFSSAIMNNDIEAVKDAASKGANIFKRSYWAYKYAELHKYDDIVEWLKSNGALIPTSEEHYPSASDIQSVYLQN